MKIQTCRPGCIYRCGRCKIIRWTADGFIVELDRIAVCPFCLTPDENKLLGIVGKILFRQRENPR